jgi:hypothetical protein
MISANPERRSNLVLRALIDDMLARVRELNSARLWAEGERERAEAELEDVMDRVRRIATQGPHGEVMAGV